MQLGAHCRGGPCLPLPFRAGPHPILGPYLHIVILLPHLFISQKLIDGNRLPPCREEERAGRLWVRAGQTPVLGTARYLGCHASQGLLGGLTRLQGAILGQMLHLETQQGP